MICVNSVLRNMSLILVLERLSPPAQFREDLRRTVQADVH